MAQTYTRQSTFADGDTITAALFNDEYNQLVNAFAYSSSSASSTGHRHDGTAGQGGNIFKIGDLDFLNKIEVDGTNNRLGFYVEVSSSAVEQIRIQDGAIVPVTDSDIDLGTTSLRFKDTFTDSITTTGNVDVGGNLTVTGTTTFNGGTITMGDAATDNVVFGADVDSSIIPDDDDTYDLGSSSQQWRNIFIDGTANIDSLVADTADINGGTIDGAIIGGSSAAAITGTAITGTSFVIGSADISEAELETIDGVTAGTVTASKAVVVDSNKDIASFRNITLTGELDAGSLNVSGDVDVDGTLETDALSINGTAVTSTAAELNILDGVTSTAAELNILDGVTSTAAELNILDGVTATAAEINALDGITSTVAELNILDGVTASAADINLIDGITNGTVIASKAIITDANKDITGGRNITISGELDAATLDISGDADIDGTLEADAITIGGVTLAETISDTVGAMVSSNTETNITVSYDDSDNTLDFVIGTLNQDTTGNAATATALATARTIHGVSFDGTANIDLSEVIQDTVGAMVSSNTETNITVTYQDSDGTLDFAFSGSADTTGNAATATALETARTIHGVSFDGTANIDLTEVVQDTVGAMFSSNTESGITVAYEDSDGTIDLTVGTLNQNTTGSAATLTTARTIGGVSFDGSANITPTTFTTATFSGDVNVDSGVLFVDVSENRIGINQTSPDVSLDLGANTDSIHVPVGTTAQRPGSPAAGYFRYNSTTGGFEGYTDEWGAIAGGGGGSSSTFAKNTFTGDGSTTAFTLSTSMTNEDGLIVFIDGVYQADNVYSVSGTTLTFATAPVNSRVIEVFQLEGGIVGVAPVIATMTGDGSDTTLALGTSPDSENQTFVTIDGVVQHKDTYAVSGSTLTFSAAPPTGTKVEAITFNNVSVATFQDADGDTKIQLEESTDEDTIRMDIAGTEVLTLTNSAMTLKGTTPTLTIGDGGAEDTKIVFDGQEDYYIGLDDSADSLVIGHGSTVGTAPAISINTSEQVILESTLHLLGGVDRRIQLSTSGSGSSPNTGDNNCHVRGNDDVLILNCAGNGAIKFQENGSEKMRLDSAGRFMIGTTTEGQADADDLTVANASGNVGISLRTTTTGFASIYFSDATSGGAEASGAVQYKHDDNYMRFTTAEAERMRIDFLGRILFNTTSPFDGTTLLQVGGINNNQNGMGFKNSSDTGTIFPIFFHNAGGGLIGSINNNGSSTTFSTSSDYRLKENVNYEFDALSRVAQLKPARFNFIANADTTVDGFLAHEVSDIVPEAITGEKDGELMQGIDQSKLVPLLTKAIQEQQTQIEALQSEINTLKGGE